MSVGPEIAALRRLLYCGEWIHSHALHIVLLHAPDFLGYPDGISLAKDRPEFVERGLALKKAGNRLMEQIGGRAIHPVNVRLGGFYSVPHSRDLERTGRTVAPRARRRARHGRLGRRVHSLRSNSITSCCRCSIPPRIARYPIENGTIQRSAEPVSPQPNSGDHVIESQVRHSTALHATLDGNRYLTGPLARYSLNSTALSPIAREAAARPVWEASAAIRSAASWCELSKSSRHRGRIEDHRRIRASADAVRRCPSPRRRRTRCERSATRPALPPIRNRRRRTHHSGDDRSRPRRIKPPSNTRWPRYHREHVAGR